ncbi:hypothetical protein BDV98DRAFT_131689 [Pterulicium gracile]|uniref:DUF6593 domain-containing protein n=1 Tax=Pterulicium gracile TaxID=1884261 RepID=A0A5C3QD67_9AGAR|nr:hypothetical protein BDV98DRAFT_131689 [Pterula gracilis]
MDIIRRVRSRNTNEASESSTGSRWTIGTFGRSSPTNDENDQEARDPASALPLPESEYPMPSPSPAPVVLNWQPSELYDNTPDPHLELQRAELERLGQLRQQSIAGSRPPSYPDSGTMPMPHVPQNPPDDLPAIIITEGSHPGHPSPPPADADQMPPGYEESRFPTVSVVYSFSPTQSGSSMLLIPPPAHPDSRPLYHISVHPNVFVPLFYKTRVTRGGSIEGEEVGDFEMNIFPADGRLVAFGPPHESTVSMRGKEHPLDMILTREAPRKLHWRFVVARMKWDCQSIPFRCSLHADETALASFTPAAGKREPGRPPPLATLEVLPAGFRYLDDIVVSILVIERQRLTPFLRKPRI